MINTATVTGLDMAGLSLVSQDSHSTTIDYNPVLQLTKEGPSSISIGEPAHIHL